jgi:hypothetical protein
MRRAMSDAMITAAGALTLVIALVAFDDRVREQISLRLAASPSVELARAGQGVRDLTTVIIAAAREQSLAHAPLVIFTLAGIVLVLFMLRT